VLQLSGHGARPEIEGDMSKPLFEARMNHEADLIRHGVRTPRAAAIAGILFSLLLIGSMLLIKTSIPADPLTAATDVMTHSRRISLGLNLLPFAGISFLWFVGVLRDRMGKLEDRFFATVFLGSALLFLAMIFAAGAVAAGIIRLLGSGRASLMGPGVYALGRVGIYQVMHVYAIRMAGVFMISTSTIALRTRIVPRWMAFLGFALALVLLLSNGTIDGILMVFPFWVLLISVYILMDNFRGASGTAAASAKE
jgi:hypothetical protein